MSLTITGSSGSPAQAFLSSKRAKTPFPKVGLTYNDGQVIAAPFVKTPMNRITDLDGPVEVEGELVFPVPALMVSMIKAAHLGAVQTFGVRLES